jgi:predicted phage-related endonuclease
MPMPGDGDDDFRSKVVGASEVAALFDAHPWLTRFELFHRKAGSISTPDFAGSERAFWGTLLEPAIIQAACERYGIERAETPKRLDNGAGLGGHPDQVVICPKRGRGILEVKTADWLVAKGWGDEPPLNYLLQVMSYAGLAGCTWGDVIVLVGGNELRRFEYEFRPAIYAEIEKRVAAFWSSVRAGEAPKPDYTRDGSAISALYPDATDEVVDLRTNNLAADAGARWLAGKALERQGKAQAEAAQAEIMDKIGDAGVALLDGMTVKCPTVKATPDRIISAENVGEVIKGRKSYRRFSITEKQA